MIVETLLSFADKQRFFRKKKEIKNKDYGREE